MISDIEDQIDSDKEKAKEDKYFLPLSDLEMFLRIENKGCDIDIIAISVTWESEYKTPFESHLPNAYLDNSEQIEYHLTLKSENIMECILKMEILLKSYKTNTKFKTD